MTDATDDQRAAIETALKHRADWAAARAAAYWGPRDGD